MSKAKEYLKRVGLIQSPYISQERVIMHLEAFANEQLKAITVTHCCTQLPTFDESNLNKNEYADDVQKTIHKNLCKPSYKIGWENCYGWLKQSLNK